MMLRYNIISEVCTKEIQHYGEKLENILKCSRR